MQLILVKQT
uniref:Uncharacterized protein n=1 Tax=Arundo donax TaxID=35708 RepID=A0A0A8YLZ4_ARUDO